ncbi:M15 family metallopeptidase [Rubrivivax gelatinosus]|uniref:Peptidoglycan L-alanyl-D-glutamate endopeptidase CwlK n=1 Tax=Rubrivivax gelatinosus TaxID=28068 RepID=A0A4R2MC23_RUBGE|nr:M15 family metallopeptidase [Rubrivivax gelatinosus]MBK1685887.1 peptidase M15 [Rubrivivax gelatinosus]TCP04090.1 peptidoglycan L-alanyl-D-glutamate endopeptidase CwlK [Rubrivivax gelatinosus]
MSSPVVLAAVLLYFGLVSLVLGLIMLPSWQEQAAELVARLRRVPRPAPAADRAPSALQAALDAETLPPSMAVLALLTAVLVAAGPVGALLLHEPAGDTRQAPPAEGVDGRFATLFELGRPGTATPTPPAWGAAATPSHERRSAVGHDWARLQPQFRQRLLELFDIARERHGYDLVLLEGYRSPARQAQLAALGPATTLAGPERSRHQAGLAADLAFIRDGRLQLSERDPWTLQAYRHVGEIATTLGLQWGGHWPSLRDFGHVEWRDPAQPATPQAGAPMLAAAR